MGENNQEVTQEGGGGGGGWAGPDRCGSRGLVDGWSGSPARSNRQHTSRPSLRMTWVYSVSEWVVGG